MKKVFFILIMVMASVFCSITVHAQCSICAKTTEQMGEKPAKGFNSGIIYLMLVPFGIMGYLGYRWYMGNKDA